MIELADPKLVEDTQTAPRDLSVLRQTLAPEQIDRAVLDRLLNEINLRPQQTASTLAISETELHNIAITVSNAKNFINDNEMANIQAMCKAWNESTATGDTKVSVALDAYKSRRQFTLDFIARYYRVVLIDIESMLNEQSKVRFGQYMDDRRRRMASSGASYSNAIAENVRSGRESVLFHCDASRP